MSEKVQPAAKAGAGGSGTKLKLCHRGGERKDLKEGWSHKCGCELGDATGKGLPWRIWQSVSREDGNNTSIVGTKNQKVAERAISVISVPSWASAVRSTECGSLGQVIYHLRLDTLRLGGTEGKEGAGEGQEKKRRKKQRRIGQRGA